MCERHYYPDIEKINVEAEVASQARRAKFAAKHLDTLNNLTEMKQKDREDAASRYRHDAVTSPEKIVELVGKSGNKGIEALLKLDPRTE